MPRSRLRTSPSSIRASRRGTSRAGYFPGLGAYGLEAAGSIGVRVTSIFGLRAGVDFRQYALDLSHATGMLMANQASDRYITIWGGLEIVLDGAGSGGAVKPPSENRPPSPPVNPAD